MLMCLEIAKEVEDAIVGDEKISRTLLSKLMSKCNEMIP